MQQCIRVMCETEVLRENPVPVPLCPPQTPHGLPRIAHKPPQWETGDQMPELWSSEGRHEGHKAQDTASTVIQKPGSN